MRMKSIVMIVLALAIVTALSAGALAVYTFEVTSVASSAPHEVGIGMLMGMSGLTL